MGYRLILQDPSDRKQYVFIFENQFSALSAVYEDGELESSEGLVKVKGFEFIRLEKVALGL
ncbi:hypothetical protein [Bacillus wiedmannii]|uniref:hypothetical protein n=1 Tax=Bacillus wiedmannii TaxID=1890302 RepID=UPI000BF127B3|nr:hypothetical protein [Bacillus wiedmannii]MBG9828517.1 hypothetical protein [Bacillus wiedmannii]PEO38306.1 hypothetical protein CN555_13950 [Bacillus wiedmannii]UOB95789.1 hypothetical protein BTI679_31330 [Bacillus wiedmannii]